MLELVWNKASSPALMTPGPAILTSAGGEGQSGEGINSSSETLHQKAGGASFLLVSSLGQVVLLLRVVSGSMAMQQQGSGLMSMAHGTSMVLEATWDHIVVQGLCKNGPAPHWL